MKKKKMKILMFNRWVGYNEGGNETHIKELAVFLNKQGHTIDILTTGIQALEGIKKHLNKIYTVETSQEYFSYTKNRLFLSLKYLIDSFLVMDRLIRKEGVKYDVITVHFSLEAFLLRFIRFIYKIPYVLILVGDTDLELIEGKRANNVSQLTHFMGRECVPYGYYPEILTKGVDRERFNKNVSGTKIRKKYITREDQFLVLTVCRLDPRKNLQTFIKAAKRLEAIKKDTFKFVIVGGGIEEKRLKNMVRGYKLENVVHFAGSIPSTSRDLTGHYAAADVYAMPTLYEGFGYVFSEAMAFGLPVISTDTSAVPEVIEDVGIIIPVKSPKALADAILKVQEDTTFRKDLSTKSLRKVEVWYWDVLIGKYEKFLYKGIENFKKRDEFRYRFEDFFSSLIVDVPRIIYVTLKILTAPKNRWGPLKKK